MAVEDGVEGAVDHLHRSIYSALLGGRPLKWMREANASSTSGRVSNSGTSGNSVPSSTAESAQVGRAHLFALLFFRFHSQRMIILTTNICPCFNLS